MEEVYLLLADESVIILLLHMHYEFPVPINSGLGSCLDLLHIDFSLEF